MEYLQQWNDVLFLHWRVEAEALRPHIPTALGVDTFDGLAWVSAVIFRLRVRARWLPYLPFVSTLTEVNLRTYVRRGERPGIFFLGVRADNHVAVPLARWLTPIPYEYRPLQYESITDGYMFRNGATHLTFQPTGSPAAAPDGSLDEWLLERYRLYAGEPLVEAEVVHERWSVRDVAIAEWTGGFGDGTGFDLNRPPDAAHFSTGVSAAFGSFRRTPIREQELLLRG